MKIAFMYHDGLNYNGGPAINALRLLPELQRRGHEVTAIALYFDTPSNAIELRLQGVNTIEKRYSKYSENLVRWILYTIKDISPDVFVPNIVPQGGYAARWVKAAGIPTVMTHRSADGLNRANARVFSSESEKWACSGLVCVSKFLEEEVLATGKTQSLTTVIPSGVPITKHVADQKSEPLRIVFAGRLVQRQKRILDLTDSFTKVAHRFEHIHFTIIGEGRERRNVTKMIDAANVASRFTLTGRLTGEGYIRKLMQHHVIVLLSDYEGIPGALMDGMASGLVPITLPTDGIEELVKDGINGFVVSDRTDSFFNCVSQLANSVTLRQRLANKARSHIIANYSLTVAANRWEDFLGKLLEESGPKRDIIVPKWIRLPQVPRAIRVSDRRKTDLVSESIHLASRVKRHLIKYAAG